MIKAAVFLLNKCERFIKPRLSFFYNHKGTMIMGVPPSAWASS